MRQLYLAVCVPRFLYGADLFLAPPASNRRIPITGAKERERGVVKKLRTVQRRAALAITGALSTTPTDVLDAYANLLPIEHQISKARFQAGLRLSTRPKSHPLHNAVRDARAYRKAHPTPIHDLVEDFHLWPHKMEEIEAVRQPATWRSSMAVIVPSSKEEAARMENLDTAEWKVYTDGLGIEGRIGASAVLFYRGEERASLRLCLGDTTHHTVFEGEGAGGILALALLRKQRNVEGPVTIIVDSQPAIKATANATSTPSHWIWDAWHVYATVFAKKHPRAIVTIRWAPGHIGIAGNERADEEAKRAAQHDDSSSQAAIPKALRGDLPWSRSAIRQDYYIELRAAARQTWERSPRFARIAPYDDKILKGSYVALAGKLPRSFAVLLLQLRTGHVPLAKHLHRINKAESPICPCCRQADETVAHYLLHCSAHREARRELVSAAGRDATVITKLLGSAKLYPLLFCYIARTERFRNVHGLLPLPPTVTMK
jgi:ribonuclease HI